MLTEVTNDPRDADELGQYRSLSTLAVAACILGLASGLAVIAAPLGVVPLTAAAIAALALARIRSSRGALTGGWLARVGLVLAIVFAVAAFSRVYLRDGLSIRLAEATARQWLSAVTTGKIEQALELMAPAGLMKLQLPPEDQNSPPPPFDPIVAIDILRQDPLLHALEPATETSEVSFSLVKATFFGGARAVQVGCRFEAAETHVEQVELRLVLQRMVSPGDEVVWLVESWELLNPSADELRATHRH
jgi:hypothetical protein